MSGRDLHWQDSAISAEERRAAISQRGCAIWLTGLSGAGKSSIARELERRLIGRSLVAYTLDGDNIRHGLCGDLGFSPADRRENIRRVGEVVRLMVDAGVITIIALISPYRADRDAVRARLPEGAFLEVFVDAPLAVCEGRDPKGLYARARAGLIPDFTGISAPYEPPSAPELILPTAEETTERCVQRLLDRLLPLVALERRGEGPEG
ncbi:MAG: adenylyl-sulfate kinase [Myxococcales bacterium]|nr:adenylyl-sulfate kinase [Myxococcales bacterium]